jgi:hypothetical protein
MESAIIIFHKNALTYYDNRWLKKCLDTIENQTYQNFDIFELDYSDSNPISLIKHFDVLKDKKLYHFHKPLKDHSYAMNFLFDKVFKKNYKYCFMVHIDDFYDLKRFEIQVKILKKFNFDMVSSNMYHVDENDNIINKPNLSFKYKNFNIEPYTKQRNKEVQYIREQLLMYNHNIIAHPSVCFTKKFWLIAGPYKHMVPIEDFDLFKRACRKNLKIHIINKFLLYYRMHGKQSRTLPH